MPILFRLKKLISDNSTTELHLFPSILIHRIAEKPAFDVRPRGPFKGTNTKTYTT